MVTVHYKKRKLPERKNKNDGIYFLDRVNSIDPLLPLSFIMFLSRYNYLELRYTVNGFRNSETPDERTSFSSSRSQLPYDVYNCSAVRKQKLYESSDLLTFLYSKQCHTNHKLGLRLKVDFRTRVSSWTRNPLNKTLYDGIGLSTTETPSGNSDLVHRTGGKRNRQA